MLPQAQDQMLFLENLGLDRRLDPAREKDRLPIAAAERSQRLVPAEQVAVEL